MINDNLNIPEHFDTLWENLTLADDFLFGKVMSNEELYTEMIKRIFPNIETRETLDTRGVRFDVFAKTDNRKIFSVEIQTTDKKDLPRRTRAYHIINGLDALNKDTIKTSGKYNDLPDVFVIFICTFDPFKQERHIYSFSNICKEDQNLKLNDGSYTVFLNTEGTRDDISQELKAFLNFIVDRKSADPFVTKLEQSLYEAKQNAIWRRKYMLLLTREQEKFAEGRDKGAQMEKERVAVDMLKRNFPLSLYKDSLTAFRQGVVVLQYELAGALPLYSKNSYTSSAIYSSIIPGQYILNFSSQYQVYSYTASSTLLSSQIIQPYYHLCINNF